MHSLLFCEIYLDVQLPNAPFFAHSQITGLAFSSIDSDCIYVQGVDYEVSFSINMVYPCQVQGVSLIDILSSNSCVDEISLYLSIFAQETKTGLIYFSQVNNVPFCKSHLGDSFLRLLSVLFHLAFSEQLVPCCVIFLGII